VCQLKKSLYGLQHATRAWYEKINNFFLNFDFKCCESDYSIYVFHVDGETSIVALYVYDLVINGSDVDLILGLKKKLVDTFEMTDLGLFHFFLVIQVLQIMDDVIFIKYVLTILHKFRMEYCKPCSTTYQLGVKLTKERDSLKVNATLYR
jgi:hypothetical protein